MTDDAKTEETKAWTYTAPKDGEACWSDLVLFGADAACPDSEKAADQTGVSAEGKLGATTKDKYYVKACAEKKLDLVLTEPAAADGQATDAEVTTAEGTAANKVVVTLTAAAADEGKQKCTKWPDTGSVHVTFTVGGWAAPGKTADGDEKSGAKTLAAAFTAGALAVAATQF